MYAANDPLSWFDPQGLANLNYFNQYTDPLLWQLAQQWNPSGVYSIAGHGLVDQNLDSLNQIVLPNGTYLTPQQLAQRIMQDANWKRQPIVIRGCALGEGNDSFAQQLADLLGVDVTAGTGIESWTGLQLPFNLGLISLGISFPLGGQVQIFNPQR